VLSRRTNGDIDGDQAIRSGERRLDRRNQCLFVERVSADSSAYRLVNSEIWVKDLQLNRSVVAQGDNGARVNPVGPIGARCIQKRD